MNENYDLNEQTFNNDGNEQAKSFVYRTPYGLNEKTYGERKGIRKASRLINLAFLILLFISSFAAYIPLLILVIAGFSYNEAVGILTDPYNEQIFQIFMSCTLFLLPFILISKLSKQKVSQIVNFSKPDNKNWFPIALMGVGFCSFANIAVSIAGGIFESFGINYEVDYGEIPTGVIGIALNLLSTAVIPPLVEEFACRGIVLGFLRRYGDGFAVFVSSLLFGIIHGNFQQAPFAFIIGLILGFVTVKCNSIWPAILIHAYNNFMAVVFDYLFMDMSANLQNIIYTVYLMLCLLVSFLGILLLKNDTLAFRLNKSQCEATPAKRVKWFFTTELSIFVIILCLSDAIKYFF